MLDDKLLEPLKNGHLMISPRVKDTAKELFLFLSEQLFGAQFSCFLPYIFQPIAHIILLQLAEPIFSEYTWDFWL